MKCPKCDIEMTCTSKPDATTTDYICQCGLEVIDKRVDVKKSLIEATYDELLTELKLRSADNVDIIGSPTEVTVKSISGDKYYSNILTVIVVKEDVPVFMAVRR